MSNIYDPESDPYLSEDDSADTAPYGDSSYGGPQVVPEVTAADIANLERAMGDRVPELAPTAREQDSFDPLAQLNRRQNPYLRPEEHGWDADVLVQTLRGLSFRDMDQLEAQEKGVIGRWEDALAYENSMRLREPIAKARADRAAYEAEIQGDPAKLQAYLEAQDEAENSWNLFNNQKKETR